VSFQGEQLVLPKTVDALIDMLDTRAFPLKSFPETATLTQMHRHFGARDVVDLLRILQKERDAPEE